MIPTTVLSREQMLHLPPEWFPALVLSDNLTSLFSAGIKVVETAQRHRPGRYNHSMWLFHNYATHRPCVASQDWRYEALPLEQFLGGEYRVKICRRRDWTTAQRSGILKQIQAHLAARGKYDWLGILGQLVRLRGLGIPGRDYCSEAAGEILAGVGLSDRDLTAGGLALADEFFSKIVYDRNPHQTPADLDDFVSGRVWEALHAGPLPGMPLEKIPRAWDAWEAVVFDPDLG